MSIDYFISFIYNNFITDGFSFIDITVDKSHISEELDNIYSKNPETFMAILDDINDNIKWKVIVHILNTTKNEKISNNIVDFIISRIKYESNQVVAPTKKNNGQFKVSNICHYFEYINKSPHHQIWRELFNVDYFFNYLEHLKSINYRKNSMSNLFSNDDFRTISQKSWNLNDLKSLHFCLKLNYNVDVYEYKKIINTMYFKIKYQDYPCANLINEMLYTDEETNLEVLEAYWKWKHSSSSYCYKSELFCANVGIVHFANDQNKKKFSKKIDYVLKKCNFILVVDELSNVSYINVNSKNISNIVGDVYQKYRKHSNNINYIFDNIHDVIKKITCDGQFQKIIINLFFNKNENKFDTTKIEGLNIDVFTHYLCEQPYCYDLNNLKIVDKYRFSNSIHKKSKTEYYSSLTNKGFMFKNVRKLSNILKKENNDKRLSYENRKASNYRRGKLIRYSLLVGIAGMVYYATKYCNHENDYDNLSQDDNYYLGNFIDFY